MTTPTVFLPVDLTGASPDNFISGEYHQITSGAQTIIRPNFGDFYKAGFQLYGVSSESNMTLLRPGVDYELGHLNEQATAESAGDVHQVVLLKDTRFFTTFAVSYHAFGGANNVNYPRLYTLYYRAKLGIPTRWADLTNTPGFYQPESHKNDAKDLYGLEYLTALIGNLKSAMTSARLDEGRHKHVRSRLRSFEASLQQTSAAVPASVRKHIDNKDYAHAYDKVQIGLGQVVNYAFTPVTINGVTLPAYASPQILQLWTATSIPTAAPPVHIGLTNNPHNSNKAMVGLGNVANFGFQGSYAQNTSAYQTLLTANATQVYLGPASFVWSVGEFASNLYATVTQPIIDSAVTEANAKITQAQTILASAASVQTSVQAILAPLQASTIDIDRKAAQAVALNKRFNIMHGNSLYCETLIKLMTYEQTKFDVGQSTTPDGYYPVPGLIDGLALWISAENPMNQLMVDMNGKLRAPRVVDRSPYQRIFEAPLNTAPYLDVSQDVVNQVEGITTGKVFHFKPGLCWNQLSGKPIVLKPGMTIIALVRPANSENRMELLTNPHAANETGIYSFGADEQALVVRSGSAWRPLEAPSNSATPQTSTIVAGVISDDSEAFCWLASTKAINYIRYPRGLNTPATSWPDSQYATAPLTQIGNANYGIAHEGELAELIIYDRALNKPEVRAVTEYLKLRYSDMTALSVDFTALNAF